MMQKLCFGRLAGQLRLDDTACEYSFHRGGSRLIREIESKNAGFKGWATPGTTPIAAALDLARAICRRAERRLCALKEAGGLKNGEIIVYLNRLSDLLWLFARYAERQK